MWIAAWVTSDATALDCLERHELADAAGGMGDEAEVGAAVKQRLVEARRPPAGDRGAGVGDEPAERLGGELAFAGGDDPRSFGEPRLGGGRD